MDWAMPSRVYRLLRVRIAFAIRPDKPDLRPLLQRVPPEPISGHRQSCIVKERTAHRNGRGQMPNLARRVAGALLPRSRVTAFGRVNRPIHFQPTTEFGLAFVSVWRQNTKAALFCQAFAGHRVVVELPLGDRATSFPRKNARFERWPEAGDISL